MTDWTACARRFSLRSQNLDYQRGSIDTTLCRTETYTNVMPRYALLHVAYRLNKQPKK